MPTFRRPTIVAMCLLLSACGSAPSSLVPLPDDAPEVEAAVGGGGGAMPAAPLTGEQDPAASSAPASPPATSPAPSASAEAVPPRSGGSSGGNSAPAPTPSASPTPSPAASSTPAPQSRTLVVAGDRHLAEVKTGKAFGTSPFTITSLTTEAYNNKAAGLKFTALAGATRGRYGWRYGRITPENADDWGGDIGGAGTVFFLDSLGKPGRPGGEEDNDGSWVITETHNDGQQLHEIRTEVFAKTDVCLFDPDRVASLDLGAERGEWRITAAWENAQSASITYPGCFLVFTRPDGVRDFAIVGPGETTIEARGYVYAFFITEAGEKPDGDLRLTLTSQ